MTGPRVAVVRRVLPAPPDVVFDEWLDPVGMTEWMCPRPARAVKIMLEPSVGGSLRIDIEDSGFSLYVTGQFIELGRDRRTAERGAAGPGLTAAARLESRTGARAQLVRDENPRGAAGQRGRGAVS